VAWIKAVLVSPGLARAFAHAIPGVLPHALPEGAMSQVAGLARMFGAPQQRPEAVG
jgi:hypothetical protein